ncbi:MAG: hypothetical protein GW942_02425 [Candidatus Pacebacteria bacterium]|nr:hypothetical protein [Candidatus Paceibacterota bacterium]
MSGIIIKKMSELVYQMNNSNYQPTISKTSSTIALFSFFAGLFLFFIGIVILIFIINSLKDIFPNQTYINEVDISLLTKEEAKQKLKDNLKFDNEFKVTIKNNQAEISSSSAELAFSFLIDKTIDDNFIETHQKLNLKKPIKLYETLFKPKKFSVKKEFSKENVSQLVEEFSNKVDQTGHDPKATLEKVGKIISLEIDPGKIGLEVNRDKMIDSIITSLEEKSDYEDLVFKGELEKTHYELNQEEIRNAEQRATQFFNQELLLKNDNYKDIKLTINDQSLIELLAFPEGVKDEKINNLINNLNNQVKRESMNAVFDYEKNEDGNINVKEFTPHQDGLEINQAELDQKIKEFINTIDKQTNSSEDINTTTLILPLQVIEPDITLEKTNDLGIKELIGFGDSEYDHSIPNRIWNVNLTAEKLNNIIVAPGEEFRFNNALGEVSKRTGYRSAYVISGGKTVLGDGGGVCQVSTTYFRAILNAGLEVTKRKAHSYRVSYYELNQKPGIDATVYSGDVDLRFINDTGNYILIRSSAYSDDLYMTVEIYGTSDGRTTEIVDHKTWDLRGAPAPAYYPTTEIPTGSLKQIDWAVPGIKASFKNVVKDKDGKIIREEEYYSNYVPWSAKYLQGI